MLQQLVKSDFISLEKQTSSGSIEQFDVVSVACALLLNLSFAADGHLLLFKIDGINSLIH